MKHGATLSSRLARTLSPVSPPLLATSLLAQEPTVPRGPWCSSNDPPAVKRVGVASSSTSDTTVIYATRWTEYAGAEGTSRISRDRYLRVLYVALLRVGPPRICPYKTQRSRDSCTRCVSLDRPRCRSRRRAPHGRSRLSWVDEIPRGRGSNEFDDA